MDYGGRWVFESFGGPIPAEQELNVHARRKKDRFTSADLRALVAAYGLPYPEIDALIGADEYVLLRERFLNGEWEEQIERRAGTPEQRADPGSATTSAGSDGSITSKPTPRA